MNTLDSFRETVIDDAFPQATSADFLHKILFWQKKSETRNLNLIESAQIFEAYMMASLVTQAGLSNENELDSAFHEVMLKWRFDLYNSEAITAELTRDLYVQHSVASNWLVNHFGDLSKTIETLLRFDSEQKLDVYQAIDLADNSESLRSFVTQIFLHYTDMASHKASIVFEECLHLGFDTEALQASKDRLTSDLVMGSQINVDSKL